jgi:predicted metal-dependent phosphoesterase TrpH
LLAIADKVDAIEVFNARCVFNGDNDRAVDFAKAHGLAGTIGSDSHSSLEYGTAMARMQPFEGPSDFLASLRQAEYIKRLSPGYVHFFSKYAQWTKKLGLRERLWEGG